jgi:small subunit ribosomal protein S6
MARTIQNYESLVILNHLLPEAEREALIDKLRKIIVEGGAELKETALWGKRRLAYPIEKRSEGYYVVFYFQSVEAAAILTQLERVCRYDENVMRSMTIKVPTRKRGQEVAQLVPTPGWLANFKLEPRSMGPRRRPEAASAPAVREREAAVAKEGGEKKGAEPAETVASAVAETPPSAMVETPASAVAETPPSAMVETPASAVAETPPSAMVETPASAVIETPANMATEAAESTTAEEPTVTPTEP